MSNTITNEPKAHPFEIAGMGLGPYRFGGIIEMPNLADEGAANFANGDPYAEVRAAGLKAGAGTCACCGMAITVICVVIDGAGDKWGVGSDCVEKADQPALCNAARVAVAKRRNKMTRERNAAKREAKRLAFQNAACTDARAINGETNAQFVARQYDELVRAETARKAAIKQKHSAAITALQNCGTDFHRSLAAQLRDYGNLSPNQARYAAKAILGRETKSNAGEFAALIESLEGRN